MLRRKRKAWEQQKFRLHSLVTGSLCFDWCSQRRYNCCDAPLSIDANADANESRSGNGFGGVGASSLISDGGERWESAAEDRRNIQQNGCHAPVRGNEVESESMRAVRASTFAAISSILALNSSIVECVSKVIKRVCANSMRAPVERTQDPLACLKSICHCFEFPHVSTKDGPNEFGMSMTISRVLNPGNLGLL
jgi:hypothetical protein